MKKIACIVIACLSLLSTNAITASATQIHPQKEAIVSGIQSRGVITNHYTAKVGLTQVLTGDYAEYGFTGAECATLKAQGQMILVTGTRPGTVVVDCYLNGVYRTRNYITFKY